MPFDPAASEIDEPARRPASDDLTIDVAPGDTVIRDGHAPGGPPESSTLQALRSATAARIGVGRAGPRPRTAALLRFRADHAVAQDAIEREIDHTLIEELGLFAVSTRVTGGRREHLLRPDLGRRLSDAGRRIVRERCRTGINLQVVLGDGLSAAAVEANARVLLPAIVEGAAVRGLTAGVPFLVKQARVGVINEIGDLLRPDVVVLLIGERPGLGRAESLSAYMAYRPKARDTDAKRDVISNIFPDGGIDPFAAAVMVLDLSQQMMRFGASGVALRLAVQAETGGPDPT